MGKESQDNIVVNDLLSFLVCKHKTVPKEKLLKCVSEFYSETAIAEGLKILLATLPVKKSTRHGRRVKHPDPLFAIYDCIQLIPKEDMPTFVCKDLNNIPHLQSVVNSATSVNSATLANSQPKLKSESEESNEEDDFESLDADNFEKIEKNIFRKEQKQMRSQISQMFSIITEIKAGLQKFNERQKEASLSCQNTKGTAQNIPHHSQLRSKCIAPLPEYSPVFKHAVDDIGIEEMMEQDEPEIEERLKKSGLALLQKLIDEDVKNEHDVSDKEGSFDDDDDPEDIDEWDDLENFDEYNSQPRKDLHSVDHNLKKTKIPHVTNAPTQCGERIIVIKDEPQENDMLLNLASQDQDWEHLNPEVSSRVSQEIEVSSNASIFQKNSTNIVPASTDETKGKEENLDERRHRYECHYCMETFSSYKKMRKHLTAHRVVKNSCECILCHTVYTNRDELRHHFGPCLERNRNQFKENICNVCNTFYASIKALKQHRNLHEEFRPFACPQCPYRYLNESTLETHIKNQHSPFNTFFCPFCSHTSISNAALSKHIKVHTGEAPFECRTCGQRTKTKFLLRRHIELHGPLMERKCNKCNFVCVGLNEYLRHRRKHHGKPIVCQLCNETFKHSKGFVRHYNSHMQKKPYKCDLCGYRAIVKETLRLHKITHTGPSVQYCPECNTPCRNKRNLKRHLERYCKSKGKE